MHVGKQVLSNKDQKAHSHWNLFDVFVHIASIFLATPGCIPFNGFKIQLFFTPRNLKFHAS